MEDWRACWRKGILPQFTARELRSLRDALAAGCRFVIQGGTTMPPPLLAVEDWDVEGCCPVGFLAAAKSGLTKVGEVEAAFTRACLRCDEALGEAAGVRHFLNWWDEGEREHVSAALVAEIDFNLKGGGA